MTLDAEQYSPVEIWLVGKQCGLVADIERYAVHTRAHCYLVTNIRYHAAMACACALYYDAQDDEIYAAATLHESRSPLFYHGRAIIGSDILVYEVTPRTIQKLLEQ